MQYVTPLFLSMTNGIHRLEQREKQEHEQEESRARVVDETTALTRLCILLAMLVQRIACYETRLICIFLNDVVMAQTYRCVLQDTYRQY